jgi:eukaryotic-like serine/threonine-protein kinase
VTAAPRILGDRYRLHKALGRGGMATVWRGEDLRLQRPVAVKVLDPAVLDEPGERERLSREARTLARLAHPGIVAVHDFGLDAGTAYLVMELVDGSSLATLLRRGPLPVARAVAIAEQICDALAAAHGAGVLHRDIKPGNLLVTRAGTVKVCDFGLARSPAAATPVDSDVVSGTVEYLAPERASGDSDDARSDLYALGCVLYEMLAGAPPFGNRNRLGVLYQHLHEPPRPLTDLRADVPPALDHLVLDLLAKHPADRPQSVEDARTRLVAVAADADTGPAAAVDPTSTQAMPRHGPAHRRRWWPAWLDVAADPGSALRRLGRRRIMAALIIILVLAAGGVAALAVPGATPGPDRQAGGSPSGGSRSGDPAPGPAATGPVPSASGPAARAGPSGAVTSQAGTPAAQIAALRMVIAQEAAAGQLDPQSAGELRGHLDEIVRRLSKGQTAKATSRVAQLRLRLAGLARDQMVTTGGYQVLVMAVDRLAGAIANAASAPN